MTMTFKSVFLLALAVVTVGASGAASGCGVCVEDKIAATYDHAVIKRAIDKRQQVVFVAVAGVNADEFGRSVAKARVPGVVPGTVRTSALPAAFSFALDATEAPARAVAAFREAAGDPRARLTLVRIVRDGKMIEP